MAYLVRDRTFAVAILVRRLSGCLPRRSASVGSEIHEKEQAVRGKRNSGRLAKDCRPCLYREPGAGQDSRNRFGNRRAGHRQEDRLADSI
jgi:hypothetical protein